MYGPGEEAKGDQRSPISKFTEQAKMTGEIKVFEDSKKMSRDFVCVNDVVDVVLNANNPSGIYDLGSGDSTQSLITATYSITIIFKVFCRKFK